MKKDIKSIAKSIVNKTKPSIKNSFIYHHYYQEQIDDRLILVDSKQGTDLTRQILELLLSVQKEYGDQYKIIIASRPFYKSEISGYADAHQLRNYEICRKDSIQYFAYLSKAKLIICNDILPEEFVKKDGQVLLYVQEGIPVYETGNDDEYNQVLMYKVQRNLFASDFLLVPNMYTLDILKKAYFLDGLYSGKILVGSIDIQGLLQQENVNHDRSDKVYVFSVSMYNRVEQHLNVYQKRVTETFLKELNSKLHEDERVVLAFEDIYSNYLDLSGLDKIQVKENSTDIYETAFASDGYIGKLDSRLIEMLNIGVKTVIFEHNPIDRYLQKKLYTGMDFMDDLKALTVDDLLLKLREEKKDICLPEDFCLSAHSDPDKIVMDVIDGSDECDWINIQTPTKKVLLFSGNLNLNGMTTSLNNLLNHIKDDSNDYYVCYRYNSLKGRPHNIKHLPGDTKFIEVSGNPAATFAEIIYKYLFSEKDITLPIVRHYVDKHYDREFKRCFTGLDFDDFVQFCGYEEYMVALFEKAKGKNVIYVHNDMASEIKEKGNQSYSVVKKAYNNYDKVAVVAENLIQGTKDLSERDEGIYLAENIHNFDRISQRLEEDLKFEPTTKGSFPNTERLNRFLDSHSPIILSIGRFSPEKQHDMLIQAFNESKDILPNAGLIIIGGYGPLFDETMDLAMTSPRSADIGIIRSIANPMPILKRADLFVLCSRYEGQPMVLIEADYAKLPIIATEAIGITTFMNKHNGRLFDNSIDGLKEGFRAFLNHEIPLLGIDPQKYNEECLRQFYGLLK